jgi:hypothetical protein
VERQPTLQPGRLGIWGGRTWSMRGPTAKTTADPLYRSERNATFSYQFDVLDGRYDVVLDFAEVYWNGSGQQLFDVRIKGALILAEIPPWLAGSFTGVPAAGSCGDANLALWGGKLPWSSDSQAPTAFANSSLPFMPLLFPQLDLRAFGKTSKG